jgi:threonine dehydrogenase-like Zn-dependent dehydrogenase
MLKHLVCTAVETLDWQPYEDHAPKDDEVRVACTHGAEKHGTMQAFYKGYANDRGSWNDDIRLFTGEGVMAGFPVYLGNMQVGTVTDCGAGVSSLTAGDRVAFFGAFCPVAFVGESWCWKLEDHVDWRSATCMDPATFALGALRDGNVRIGDRVSISGLGAIGLMAVRLAKLAGASAIYALDPLANRREVALKLGADEVHDPTGMDIGMYLRDKTNGLGMDVHIDFSGNVHALQAALRCVAYGGTIVAGAFPPPYTTGLDFGAEAHMNRPHIVFSRACSDPNPDHPRWSEQRIIQTCKDMITAGLLDGSGIVTPVVPFEQVIDEYPRIAAAPETNVKLGVTYET